MPASYILHLTGEVFLQILHLQVICPSSATAATLSQSEDNFLFM